MFCLSLARGVLLLLTMSLSMPRKSVVRCAQLDPPTHSSPCSVLEITTLSVFMPATTEPWQSAQPRLECTVLLMIVLEEAPSSMKIPCLELFVQVLLNATDFLVPASKSMPSATLWWKNECSTMSLVVSAQTPRLKL